MSDQTTIGATRMQFDKQGKLIGKLYKMPEGPSVLLLETGYMLVKMQDTGRLRIWDTEKRQLVEFM